MARSGRPFGRRWINGLWDALVLFGGTWVHVGPHQPPRGAPDSPHSPSRAPGVPHPERLCPEVPLTPTERALDAQLRDL
ncbi:MULTISPECIES: DUF6059 family protein [unclassified Streptomyces]|uniref:DUF6059 family protein n=1 Tax=unclassified Streptomyces TaxID=2593676 RepID=UPI002DD7D9CA|nr:MULTISPECIES: DUF6059 family protein [unclassified Streptomyces]WSA95920.1 hypothetical protein OIE63_33455 [Streptomyces sp. NBC_01795]WSB80335.1 hypothetical protein OHB04_34570 [Streptomyces sp. NBC_01775]WSS11454.1 hypothetical protein OG533_05650 [Streptomyces sp. NBC_01186]WSS40168.1 hypothetical protein OG220_05790 [Streptomyces sp. NBC_01187]